MIYSHPNGTAVAYAEHPSRHYGQWTNEYKKRR